MAALLLGCGPGTEETPVIVVFTAASTKDAVEQIARNYEQEHRTRVKINADDSAKLATQITQGAPADVFLSANKKWADFVADKGFAKDRVALLSNSLVLVVRKANPAGINNPEDLAGATLRRLALAGPDVPAGIYARQALKKLGLWEALESGKKVVSGANVRATVAYVERGEADSGIVYATDARISDKVEVVHTFARDMQDAIRYPLVLLKEGAARDFYRFLQSDDAKDVFRKYGFKVDPD